jgi:cytochrome P450
VIPTLVPGPAYSWRRIRRAIHEALTKRALQCYHPIQTKEATVLVSSLLMPRPDLNPDKQFQRLSASTILSILYDHPTIVSEHDQTLEKIDDYNLRLSKACDPGSYFVNIFPWMRHIPERSYRFCYLTVYTDAWSNKICEMEA